MNRKLIAAASLFAMSTAALAEPYLGVGYQAGTSRIEKDSLRYPVVDGRALDQSDHESSGSLRLVAGYRFSDRWALELTAQRPTLETSIEQRVAGTGDDEEWESSVDATHVTLAPVLLHRLSDRVELRATAGLLYGDYSFKRVHALDVDNGPDQVLSREKDSDSKFGAAIGVGAAWTTPWKFDLVGEVTHQRTKLVSNSAVSLTAVYRF